jgi:hypothetical protein
MEELYVKDMLTVVCLKAMSREIVTYGIQMLDLSERPDWRLLDREDKTALVFEVALQMMFSQAYTYLTRYQSVTCLVRKPNQNVSMPQGTVLLW